MYHNENKTQALLNNGKIVDYDAASPNKNAYKDKNWYYLGEGVIYKVGGVLQNSIVKLHFWRK